MIAEIVLFDLPHGTKRTDALALYRNTTERWLSNPDLVEKYYFFDEEKFVGGGIYLWRTREAAPHWHGNDYAQMVQSLYGAPPRMQIFDVLIHIDPVAGSVTEL